MDPNVLGDMKARAIPDLKARGLLFWLASPCPCQHFGPVPLPRPHSMPQVSCHRCCRRRLGRSRVCTCTISSATSGPQVVETNTCISLAHVPATSHLPEEGFQGHTCPPGTVPCAQHTPKSFIYSFSMFSEHLLKARH